MIIRNWASRFRSGSEPHLVPEVDSRPVPAHCASRAHQPSLGPSSAKTVGAALLLAVANGSCSASTPEPPPPVPLVRLFDDGVRYGQSADGRVFGGWSLRDVELAVNGATSMTGGGRLDVESPTVFECASLQTGDVVCRGANVLGPIATPDTCFNPNRGCPFGLSHCLDPIPDTYPCAKEWTKMPLVHDIVQVHGTCGVDRSGHLACWSGPLSASFPRPIRRLAGGFAILDDGHLYDVASGVDANLADVVDASGSIAATACAVRSDSSAWCWGTNGSGGIGDGSTQDRPSPVKVGTGFSTIEVGDLLTCGLMVDGTVTCWGVIIDDGAQGEPCRYPGLRCQSTPLPVAGLGRVLQIASTGSGEFTALLGDGSTVTVTKMFSTPQIKTRHPIAP